MKIKLDGENLYIRTPYDDKNDLVQKLIGIYGDGIDEWGKIANEPVDFRFSGIIPKEQENFDGVSVIFCEGYDEAPSFKYNDSYIGGNHGQSDGVLVTAFSHGKTYADIGSIWADNDGVKWNLLRIEDENSLLFLSENIGVSKEKYRFKKAISGNKLVCCDEAYASNTEDINIEATKTAVQVHKSLKLLDFNAEAVCNGQKKTITDGDVCDCDYFEIYEHYFLMNPSLIGDALRQARPKGGYTENQALTTGEPVVECSMKYTISDDGAVVTEFDAVFLCDVDFELYSGIIYQLRADAFGGGVWRYIPKMKSFSMIYDGKEITYDFKRGYNVTEALKNKNYVASSSRQVTCELWEKPESMPDRAIDYMKDENGNVKAGFAAGYFPIFGGRAEKRHKQADSAVFMYKSGKGYPVFANSFISEEKGMKDIRLRGVAYKKYVDYADNQASLYTVSYDGKTYAYIDIHKKCKKSFKLPLSFEKEIKVLEKSNLVVCHCDKCEITVENTEAQNGYIILCNK